jgi:hypothetical protein
MNIAVVTYPRSGSTYLAWLLSLSFNKKIDKFHLDKEGEIDSLVNYDYSISTVRGPIESISSIVTMESFYFRNDQDFESYVDQAITKRIKEYVEFYSNAINLVDVLFDYEVINTQRNELVRYVSKQTNSKILNTTYLDLVKDEPKNNFLRSSQTSSEYKDIKNMLNNYDLSSCFDVHSEGKRLTLDLQKQ